MTDEVAVLKRWFLPKLFGFNNVKELFEILNKTEGISVLIDTPVKEYLLEIRFTGRVRGIPLHHPDFTVREEE